MLSLWTIKCLGVYNGQYCNCNGKVMDRIKRSLKQKVLAEAIRTTVVYVNPVWLFTRPSCIHSKMAIRPTVVYTIPQRLFARPPHGI